MSNNVPKFKSKIPKPPKFKVKSAYDRKKHLRKEITELKEENKELDAKNFLLIILFAISFLAFIAMCCVYSQVK